MCLLTYISPGAHPDMSHLERGTENNPDGFGFAIIAKGELHVFHSMDADRTLNMFELMRSNLPDDGPALFHSRIATAGDVTTFNTHPFYVGGDKRTVLAHNGILPNSSQPGWTDPRSDTHLFADKWLPKGRFGHFWSRNGRKRLSRWCGSGNKLVLLTVDPAYTQDGYIINQHLGTWDDGVWWSNDSYLKEPWWMKYDKKYDTLGSYGGGWLTDRDATVIGGKALALEPDKGSDLEVSDKEVCEYCLAKGYMSDVSFMCWCCHVCNKCGLDFDECSYYNECGFREGYQPVDTDTDMRMTLNRRADAEAAFSDSSDDIHSVASWERAGFTVTDTPDIATIDPQ